METLEASAYLKRERLKSKMNMMRFLICISLYKNRGVNMKTTDIGFERFEEDFYANPNTAFVKPEPDTRTPYEQYASGEKWIYVDLRDIFPNEKPYWISRDGYFDKFLHVRHLEYMRSMRNNKNIKIEF
jgi:isocitrate dehydrogenase kinase/phosphatase